MKISIIIPVYNTLKYLEKCFESVINQTYDNFEVIVVNDGSNDDSLIICQKYSRLDSRFKLIDKPNEGVSNARNVGIKVAQGDLICFVDSDDYIDRLYLDHLIKDWNKSKIQILFFRGYEGF